MHPITQQDIEKAKSLARLYCKRANGARSYDDIFSEALLGLTLAAQTYDGARVTEHGGWLHWRTRVMKTHIWKYFAKRARSKRGNMLKHESFEQDWNGSIGNWGIEFDPFVVAEIAKLPERTQFFLLAAFTGQGGLTVAADKEDVSFQRVQQIVNSSIQKIQENLCLAGQEPRVSKNTGLRAKNPGLRALEGSQPAQIRYLYATGLYSYRELGEAYKVSRKTIEFIVKGLSYKSFT